MKLSVFRPFIIFLIFLAVIQIGCGLSTSEQETSKKMTWELVGVGDCTGHDDPVTTDGAIPDDSRARAGYTAVCWDNETYTNALNPGKAFCTYKKIAYSSCKGGENPGEMYTAEPAD